VQQLRHAADAVITGIGTVLADDPRLTDRSGPPRRRRLLRVILDSKLRLPLKSALVKSAQDDVLVLTARSPKSSRGRALTRAAVEVLQLPAAGRRVNLRAAMAELGRRDILGALLEAGSELNAAALEAGIVDKITFFVAPKVFGTDEVPWARWSRAGRHDLSFVSNLELRRSGDDFVVEGYLNDVHGNR